MSTKPKAAPAKKAPAATKPATQAKKAAPAKKAVPAKKVAPSIKKPRRGSTTLEMLEKMQSDIQKALR